MRSAPLPQNEEARLEILRSYEILDSAGDQVVDALVRVASKVCDVPIALVTLVDEQRQWFFSKVGIDVKETPREIAFCSHTILVSPEIMEVSDATKDERFFDNPLVVGPPHVRFYAGAPLIDRSGAPLGTLCVVDKKPRRLSADQRSVLKELSLAVVRLLEQKRVERILQSVEGVSRAEEMLRQALNQTPLGLLIMESSTEITFANRTFLELLGYTAKELEGAPLSSLLPQPAGEALLGAGLQGQGERLELMARHKSGAELPVEISLFLIDGGERKRILASVVDISARIQTEQLRARMSAQERLVTTGTLAAGVGHEINNPLAYILANIDFALEELKVLRASDPELPLKELEEALREAHSGAERIRKIVRGLRAFARESTPLVPQDLDAALDTSINMAMHEIRARATCKVERGETPMVRADEGSLSQILVNLLVNAAQSFRTNEPSRNVITIRTSTDSEGWAVLEVSDNGQGIDPEVLPRIYDPFFTTKPVGVGTGLGLSICHNVVTALGGQLIADSRLGEGTTFRVRLPPAQTLDLIPLEELGPEETLRRGQVVVIDDDEGLLRAVRRLLERQHEITIFSDPRDALVALIEQALPCDVVLCDLMMPNMDGVEVYRQIEAQRPQLARRFVFISGGLPKSHVRAKLEGLQNELLEKPFDREQLQELVVRYVR